MTMEDPLAGLIDEDIGAERMDTCADCEELGSWREDQDEFLCDECHSVRVDGPPTCHYCNGSGEGTYDGSTCRECHGSGVVIRKDI